MDSKNNFLKDIIAYYNSINNDLVPDKAINDLSNFLANHFYYKYKEFSKVYPKSKKRYSKMKIEDLDNPLSHDLIIKFFKDNFPDNYRFYCSAVFKMSLDDFTEYEKNRNQFNDMF